MCISANHLRTHTHHPSPGGCLKNNRIRKITPIVNKSLQYNNITSLHPLIDFCSPVNRGFFIVYTLVIELTVPPESYYFKLQMTHAAVLVLANPNQVTNLLLLDRANNLACAKHNQNQY